jgi:hypothetical protein
MRQFSEKVRGFTVGERDRWRTASEGRPYKRKNKTRKNKTKERTKQKKEQNKRKNKPNSPTSKGGRHTKRLVSGGVDLV